jgi:hypothetical protein
MDDVTEIDFWRRNCGGDDDRDKGRKIIEVERCVENKILK